MKKYRHFAEKCIDNIFDKWYNYKKNDEGDFFMKVGLQLYSIHDIMNGRGIKTALKAADVLGFDGVEFAGFKDLTPEEMNAELAANGLSAYGAHIGLSAFEEEYDETVSYLKAIGAKTAFIPVPGAECKTEEEWAEYGKRLDKVGKKLAADGIVFGYHNHRFEFTEKFGDKCLLDVIMENTSPEFVQLELDTGHAAFVGADPVEIAKKYADRISVIHVKDTNMTEDVAAGSGVVDFKALINVAKNAEYLIVENENVGKNLEELRIGCRYLKENF